MTYKLLGQKLLGEKILVSSPSSSAYYYGGEGSELVDAEPFNEVRLDASFNADLSDSFRPEVYSIFVQPDGKIIISGRFTAVGGVTRNRIARLNSDGTLDTSFNASLDGSVSFIGPQPGGKILIAGGFENVNGVGIAGLARLNSDGTLDTSFSPNVEHSSFGGGTVYSAAFQPDNKIVIGGFFTSVNSVARNNIARLNSDGTLDTSFNPNTSSSVNSVVVQPDGKILIGGLFTTVGGVTRNRIARLNADGTLDTLFDPNANGQVTSIALRPDGKILIGGRFNTVGGVTKERLALLSYYGTLETFFDLDFIGTNIVEQIVVQPDGKFIICGDFDVLADGEITSRLARFNSDGTLDTSFNMKPSSTVYAIAIQPDGKILAGGLFSTVGGVSRLGLVRLKKNINNAPYLEIYEEFGSSIVESIFVANHNDFVNSIDIAVLPDGEETVDKKHHAVWDYFIYDNDYVVFRPKVPLQPGDRIFAYSTVDEPMSISVFGKTI